MQALILRQAALTPQQGRSAGTLSQAGQSLSHSQGASGATAGDATSSPDNTSGITREQELRPGGFILKF